MSIILVFILLVVIGMVLAFIFAGSSNKNEKPKDVSIVKVIDKKK